MNQVMASSPIPAIGRALIATIGRREREVRDMLWLLATMLWILAPHVLDLPPWCSVTIVALVVWRGWLTWSGRRLPHRSIPIALTCIAGIAVWLEYRTIFGKDAGVAYVTLLLGLKLLEMRARRDIFVVIFLCLFVMLTSLFESQTMGMAVMLLVGMWMLVTALVSVQFAEHEPRFRVKVSIATRLVLFALPLMAVLFVLFPRIDGPLWGMPSDAYNSRTGLSDVMTPGSFGRLSESREMAFRVQFQGRVPRPAERYWRGPVLGVFDGRAWTPMTSRRAASSRSLVTDPTSVVDYTMTLEPANRPWLFALDAPVERADIRHEGELVPHVRGDLQAIGEMPIHVRSRYSARSYTRYNIDAGETRARMQGWLELPPGFNPRTHALAARMLTAAQTDGDGRLLGDAEVSKRLVDRVLAMIRTQPFVYTLDPRHSDAIRSTNSCSIPDVVIASITRVRSSC